MAAVVPLSNPGAITSLLFSPRGWQSGGTSLETIAEVRALPPRPAYSPKGFSVALGPPSAPTSIRKILSIVILLIQRININKTLRVLLRPALKKIKPKKKFY
jgi:hypothetical protein